MEEHNLDNQQTNIKDVVDTLYSQIKDDVNIMVDKIDVSQTQIDAETCLFFYH